jgi:hypothetical protein
MLFSSFTTTDYTTLFLFSKKKTCAKRKNISLVMFLKLSERKVVGKAFFSAKMRSSRSIFD